MWGLSSPTRDRSHTPCIGRQNLNHWTTKVVPSNYHFKAHKSVAFSTLIMLYVEKEMATHSSVLAWRIPGTGEPGGLLSMGLHRVGHDWSDLAAAAAMLYDHHKHFYHSERNPIFKSLPSSPLWNPWQPFRDSFLSLRICLGWNFIYMTAYSVWPFVPGFFYEHRVFKVHLCCSMYN